MNKLTPEKISAIAVRYSALAILNCYVREIAIPHQLLGVTAKIPGVLIVKFPHCEKQLSISVANYSAIGNFIYTSELTFHQSKDHSAGEHFPWGDLPSLVVEELCRRYQNDQVRHELLEQIVNSTALIQRAVSHGINGADDQCKDYMQSEAALIFGHSFHPAPKCRQGFSEVESLLYGPEFGRSFQLHYFALSPEAQWLAAAEQVSLLPLISEMAEISLHNLAQGWSLLPCHPWQANYLLQLSAVNEAIANHSLIYLGASGIHFSPTASVRTLYNPEFPYFLKCSLSMRITNSVRKNAYYELEGAVRLTSILSPIVDSLTKQFPGFEFLLEPIAMSVDVPHLQEESQADLRSHFGVIFRDAATFQQASSVQHWLAAALFGDDCDGVSWLQKSLVAQNIATGNPQGKKFAQEWFIRYLGQLIPPLLSAYFEHGVACEPHLQNVVIKTVNAWPCGIILRDLEGTKLVDGIWKTDMLNGMKGRTLSSMLHDEHKTWRRLSYCLFINNIGQAVYQVCRFGVDENILWQAVRQQLETYAHANPSALVAKRIGGLLNGEPLASKANLITRFFQQADSDASYVWVPNPIAVKVSEGFENA